LKKSVVGRCEDYAVLILQGASPAKYHVNGSTSGQDRFSGPSTRPFVSMMRDAAQYARNFVPIAFGRLFQQPQPDKDIHHFWRHQALERISKIGALVFQPSFTETTQ
jgi:hypothetical protein